jgi:uncharacterized protein involved in outer membrane biogenesis
MRFRTHIVRNLLALFGLFLIVGLLIVSNISIPLDKVRPVLVSALSNTLGREVSIEGDFRLSSGLFPALYVENLYARNPEGFPDDYSLRISRAEAHLSLLALIRGDFHFTEISSNDVLVNLHRKPDGSFNWAFHKSSEHKEGSTKPLKEKLSIDQFHLSNITFEVRDEMVGRSYTDYLNSLTLDAVNSDEVRLSISATFKEVPYSAELTANPFKSMFGNNDWMLHGTGQIANKPFETSLRVNPGTARDSHELDFKLTLAGTNLQLKSSIQLPAKDSEQEFSLYLSGRNLHEMAQALNIHVPIVTHCSLRSELEFASKRVRFSDIDAQIDDLKITGSVDLDTSRPESQWKVSLTTPLIQLSDYPIGFWLKTQNSSSSKSSVTDTLTHEDINVRRAIVRKTLRNFDASLQLDLRAEQIHEGPEQLGTAFISLKLGDDKLNIDQLKITLLEGSLDARLFLHASEVSLKGHLELDAEKIDYGVLARLIKPETTMRGLMSSRIDLALDGETFDHLFDNATGKLDVALWPVDTRARVFDLWSVNLYLVLLPEITKNESKFNCGVALLDINDGIVKEDYLALDTSKVWMDGNLTVDFNEEYISLALFPKSKTARLYSLKTPIRVEGEFNKTRLRTTPLDIAGGVLSFVTSPLHVPARWIFEGSIPSDGSAYCEKLFDRKYISQLKQRQQQKTQDTIDNLRDVN